VQDGDIGEESVWEIADGYTYDFAAGQLRDSQGALVKLRPKPRLVLEVLLRAKNKPVNREEISNRVWGKVVVTDDALTQCIKDLRKALGDSSRSVLKTLPKVGYSINATERQPVVAESPKNRYSSQLKLLSACALALLLVAMALLQRNNSKIGLESRNPAIAIQQFESLVDEDRWRRLAFGLSLEVASELSNRKILSVYSVRDFDQINADFSGFILRGTLQSDNDENLRILAQLVDVDDSNRVIWNRRWNRPLEQYFDIQSEIVTGIDSALSPFWSGKINEVIVGKARRRDRNLTAYELFLKGVEHKHRFTPAGYVKAEGFLLEALDIDPDFSQAWSTLAVVYLNLGINSKTLAEKSEYQEKRAVAAKKAFGLAPENADSLVQWSWFNAYNSDWAESEAAMRKAVAHAGNDSDVLGVAALAGSQYASLGGEAVEWAMRAIEHRPQYPLWYNLAAGVALFHHEDFSQSEEYLRKAPDMAQKHLYLAAAQQKLGDVSGASESMEKLKQVSPSFTIQGYARSVAMGPELEERLTILGSDAGIPLDADHSWRD